MVKKGYSFTVGIDEDNKPRRKSPIEEENETTRTNKNSVEAYLRSNGVIKTGNEDSGERIANTQAYVNGVLNDNTEYIRQLLKRSDVPNGHVNNNVSPVSDSASSSKIHSDTVSQDSFLTSSSSSSIIYHKGNGKKVNKAYSFSVTNQNGTKHKSVIIVSKDEQDGVEIDKHSYDMPDKMQKDQGRINPAFDQETEAREISNHDENDNVKQIETEFEQIQHNMQNGCAKAGSVAEKTPDPTLVPNGESDYLQMNGFTHTTSNGDVYMNDNDEKTAEVQIKSSKGKKGKNDDKDKPPDVSFFQLVSCFFCK